MGDVLFLLALVIFLIGPFILFKRWWWTITMGIIVVVVLGAECVAVLKTEHSLSQMFWGWSVDNRNQALITIGSLSLGWVILMFHLVWRIIKPKDK